MAKKKKQKDTPFSDVTSKQVLNDETLTISGVKEFILDCKKKRDDLWLNLADRSWNEIKKRNKKGKLYGGQELYGFRRWTRFPLWWSCWQIRKPIVFARLSDPIIKDTQGDDPFGRTACILGERLTRGILKTFDAFNEFSAGVDDSLVTDFGWGRAFYRCNTIKEEQRIYLQEVEQPPMEPIEGQPEPQPMPPIFITPNGQEVADPMFDDIGQPYLPTGELVEVDNEEVYFEAGLYSNLIVESEARRWNKVTRLAFEYQYSYREFIEKFGRSALNKLMQGDIDEHKTGKPIIVYEYHDKLLKEVRWFADNSIDFFQPNDMHQGMDDLTPIDNSDLYGLSGFFPCTAPLVFNQPTDEFWPVPEYFQVADIIDDIHQIVSRMILLTKAIRVRFLFDSSIPQLSSLISETGEAGGLGIPNLSETLMGPNKLGIAGLVAYFPVAEMIEGLNNMYTGFSQRLQMFYEITGLNDLLRGQTADGDKTYGERQLEGKFALNRIEPRQERVQDWLRDNYQLLMELALKMFSDKTLDDYIVPQTLDPEDKERYVQSLELLKNNRKNRFRIDFETDSTIAINQQWKKQQAIELANVLTKAMESTASIAKEDPELAGTELKVLKHLVGELTNGKLFVDEIQDSIQQVIDKVNQPKQEPPNPELLKLQIQAQKDGADIQFKNTQLQANTQLEYAKIAQKERFESIKNQVEQLKLALSNGTAQAEIELAVTKLQTDIAQGWEDLNIKKQALLASIQAEVGKKAMDEMKTILEARVKAQEMTLAEADQALRAFEVQIGAQDAHASLQERIATEQRLQEEHQMDMGVKEVDALSQILDAVKPETPKAPPVTIDLSKTLHIKGDTKKAKKEKPK